MYGMEYPFGQAGSAFLASLLPNYMLVGITEKPEKALMLCKHSSVKTLLRYQHCLGHQSKTQHHMGCYEENYIIPPKLNPVQQFMIIFSLQ